MFVAEPRSLGRTLVLLLLVVVLSAGAVAFASGRSLDPGLVQQGSVSPYDPGNRTVVVWPSSQDDTASLIEAIATCSATQVGCTVILSPGLYTLRGFDLASFTGLLAVVGAEAKLTGLFGPVAPRPPRVGYLPSGHDGQWPAAVVVTF